MAYQHLHNGDQPVASSAGSQDGLSRRHANGSGAAKQSSENGVAKQINNRRKVSLVSHNELPEWLSGNEHLLTGHRKPNLSYRACFRSVFAIHNESLNIWTHLLGAGLFICIFLIELFGVFDSKKDLVDRLIFGVYYLGAVTCMSMSWIYHTLRCHSQEVQAKWHKMDYVGITVLIVSSNIPSLHYVFYNNLFVKYFYLCLTLTLGSACVAVSMLERFATRAYRPTRAGLFIAFGLSGVLPFLHYVITHGMDRAISAAAADWHGLMGFLYIAGAVIYALRVPERLAPGWFDIVAHSHQIFHCCVVAAALVHIRGISVAFSNRTIEAVV